MKDYRDLVEVDEPFRPSAAPAAPAAFGELVGRLLDLFVADSSSARLGVTAAQIQHAVAGGQGRALLRTLLTVRGPEPLPTGAVPLLDALLGGERALRRAVDPATLPTIAQQHPGSGCAVAGTMTLWRGDITTLAADAVVNAANSALRGCFRPAHQCVDNVIHAAAGPRLRADCHAVVTAQGSREQVGGAKITRGYHLPARFVLHTVRPAVDGPPAATHEAALAASYTACLDLVAQLGGLRTVAFCSIGTGAFGLPRAQAARIALAAVAAWQARYPGTVQRIVFAVDDPADLYSYERWVTSR